MLEQRRTLIITGLVLLLLIGLVGAVIYFLIGFIRPKTSGNLNIFPTSSGTGITIASPSPTSGVSEFPVASTAPGATNVPSATTKPNVVPPQNTKVYQGQGFQLFYPQNWGLLTCNNSQNFELDPNNPTDQKGVPCDRAVKPITILVGQSTCAGGDSVSKGGVALRKIVTENVRTTSGGSGKQYHWCTATTPSLDITHRVGTGPAFSAKDNSVEIEQMISTLRIGS